MVRKGLIPSGTDPCCMNRSMWLAKTLGSGSFSSGSIGLSGGTVPSDEPGFNTPPFPSVPWQLAQLLANNVIPEFGLPARLMADPGRPGLEGSGTSSPAGVGVMEVDKVG